MGTLHKGDNKNRNLDISEKLLTSNPNHPPQVQRRYPPTHQEQN